MCFATLEIGAYLLSSQGTGGARSVCLPACVPVFAPKVQTINGHAIGVSGCLPAKDCLVVQSAIGLASKCCVA